jgi:long-chain acyl-CoA synthetase
VNKHLASYESIKYFRILDRDFSQETGELTPSLKVKRKVVTERYRDLIDQMYA